MAISDKDNVKKRSEKSVPLTQVEVDQNFQEVRNVIDDTTTLEQEYDDHLLVTSDAHPQYAREEDLASNVVGDGSDLVAHTGTTDTVTQALDKRTIYVGSVADLRALPVNSLVVGQSVRVSGYYAAGDGGGGPLRVWKTASAGTYTDNGGSIIVPTEGDGSGAWLWENSGTVGVGWYGTEGGGADDSSKFSLALARDRSDLVLPNYKILLNSDYSKNNNIRGTDSSVIESYTATGAALTINKLSGWNWPELFGFTVDGDGAYNKDGIVFDVNEDLAGRVVFNSLNFGNALNKAIAKNSGNIGNKYKNCTFENSNYHFWAQNSQTSIMHTGADVFEQCHFRGAQVASIYINDSQIGQGQWIFDGCIFETNNDGIPLVLKLNQEITGNFELRNCWFEGNNGTGTVVIDGVTHSNNHDILLDSGHVVVKSGRNLGAKLINNATLSLDSVELTTADLATSWDVEAGSHVYIKNARTNSFKTADKVGQFTLESYSYAYRSAGGFADANEVLHRNNPVNDTGGIVEYVNDFTTGDVEDGITFNHCHEVTQASGASAIAIGGSTIAAGRWVVWTMGVKQVSGTTDIKLTSNNALAEPKRCAPIGRWATVGGITKTPASTNWAIRLENNGTVSSTLRLSDFQCVSFDEGWKAIEYFNALKIAKDPNNTYRQEKDAYEGSVYSGVWLPTKTITRDGIYEVTTTIQGANYLKTARVIRSSGYLSIFALEGSSFSGIRLNGSVIEVNQTSGVTQTIQARVVTTPT